MTRLAKARVQGKLLPLRRERSNVRSFYGGVHAVAERLGLRSLPRLGTPGDAWEREAERVADSVVRRRGKDGRLATGAGESSASRRGVFDSIRAETKDASGFDFSKVKIHADPGATELSQTLGAHAFTLGSDIFFDASRFDPSTTQGTRLLAHELAHVHQQQTSAGAANTIQRDIAGNLEPKAPPPPPPPVDCAVEITATRDCRVLTQQEMSLLRFEIDQEDQALKKYESGEWTDPDGWAAHARKKRALQDQFDQKEAIRLACCPTYEVPPLAPMAPPSPAPTPQPPTPQPPSGP